ncbi:MAG: CotH kinase family protein [Aeromicrobium sp.]
MKKKYSIPAALVSAVLMIVAMATQSGAATLAFAPPVADPVRVPSITLTPSSGQVALNEVVSIYVDFPSSGTGYSNYPLLTLEHDDGTGSWAPVTGQVDIKSTSAGTYTFKYPVPKTEKVRVTAKATDTYAANTTTPEKQLTVVPSSAVLDPTTNDGKTWTAHFTPISSGKATQLQVQEIYTYETDETNEVTTDPAYNPADKKTWVGPWRTIATSTQNSSGNTTFSVSNPLEVKHKYRAVSGATSNIVEFAAPLQSKNTGLPQVHFNTYEGDTVNTRDRYFEGEFVMTAGANLPECAPVAKMPKSVMKGRGNYSWSFEKKGYTLKIDKKTNLCGMGVGKKYALIANHYDKSLMRNMVAYNLGQKFTNLAWTPKTKSVDFFMNGNFLGNYMLVERIAIQGPVTDATYSPRVDIHELKEDGQTTNTPPGNVNNVEPNISGGYILEWDFRKGADYNPTAGSRGYVGVKDPENDLDREGNVTDAGISSQQKAYINKYLDDTDAALFGSNFQSNTSGWQKYINIDSAVDYYLAMEFLKPVDGNMWASVYMYKPRGGKIEFGPLWDFDLGLGSATRAGNVVSPTGWYLRNVLSISAKQSSKTWFNRLNEDPEFRSAVAARWNVLYPTLSSSTYIDQQKSIMAASAAENYKRWSYSKRISSYQVIKGSWSADVAYVKSWMSDRRSWLNGQY